MTRMEIAIAASSLGFLILFLVLLINAIHFYRIHYPDLSKKIDGSVFDPGFLFAANRFLMWGHYCLSKSRAERAGVYDIFSLLPQSARRQLIFHWSGMLLACFILICAGLLSYLYRA